MGGGEEGIALYVVLRISILLQFVKYVIVKYKDILINKYVHCLYIIA